MIDITRASNPNLVEKAGREGFIENRAYRQLKRLLENFFVQLAAEFFREGGLRSDEFVNTRDELVHNEFLRRKRARQVRVRRGEFEKRLDTFFEAVNARNPEAAVAGILRTAEERFAGLADQRRREDLVQLLIDLESQVHAELAAVDATYRVTHVRGFGFTRQMQRDWDAYEVERNRLEGEVFRPAAVRLADIVSQHSVRTQVDLDHRRRLDRALRDAGELQRRRSRSLARETSGKLEQVRERVLAKTRAGLIAIETAIRETASELERTNTTSLDPNGFERLRANLEDRIVTVADLETSNLEKLREQLQGIGTEEGLEQAEVTGALEEELEALRERDFAGLQLAQVGMALGIVHHEFASTIQGVRHSLRRLKPWADANSNLSVLYREIRSNFDHLDGYLTLFTPLDRRLQRRRVQIRGVGIYKFLDDLFGERLKRHEVELRAMPAFREMKIVGFPSSFYPCFVNLVDNAIFWVTSQKRDDKRLIELDADGKAFTITDSGPGIRTRDAEAVFEMGFTRRPGGRGMGLYIAQRTLNQIDYELTLDPFKSGRGARFRICPANKSLDKSAIKPLKEKGEES